MKRLAVVLTVLCAGTALAAGTTVRRFALLIGANDGGPERMRLRYAVTDAERLAQVLNELGGLDPSDMQLLEEGRREDVLRALDVLASRESPDVSVSAGAVHGRADPVGTARRDGHRTQLHRTR